MVAPPPVSATIWSKKACAGNSQFPGTHCAGSGTTVVVVVVVVLVVAVVSSLVSSAASR